MGIFQSIIKKYKDAKQTVLNKKEFKQALLQAVSDGKLTKEEIAELEQKKEELGLSDEDIKEMKAEIFTAAFVAAKSDEQVTASEEKELQDVQQYLGLADSEIQATKKELTRLRLLNEIQQGNLPLMTIANIVTVKGEKAYWAEPALLAEEKVIRTRYEGRSQGVSFRIAKGVSYRVGGFRGHAVSETGVVPVSNGEFIITSKRIIFRGDGKSFATKLDKILDIQLFTNGIHLSENNRAKPRLIKFNELGNHHIIGAVLSHAINHYGDKD
jgi:tellurite resistance protein